MLKNLEFFLQNKEKINDADQNDNKADRISKISICNTKTFNSESHNLKSDNESADEDSDEISLHMNRKLDEI